MADLKPVIIDDQFGGVTSPGGLRHAPRPELLAPAIPAPSEDQARLVVLTGAGAGRTCVVSSEVVIGRATEVGLSLPSNEVSRHHARIFRTGPREFAVQDMGSRNGTSVNGLPVKGPPRPLVFGDKIAIGSQAVVLFSLFDPAEERLVQAQKLQSLGQLASGVAHDVNNLVGSALGNLDYLRGRVQDQEDLAHAVADSTEALQRVVEMVRRLVNFSRRGRFESKPIPVAPLLQQAAQVMRHKAVNGLHVVSNVPSTLHVMGDTTQLLQVFTNLCSNAIDAMPSGGTITFEASVVDVGPGGLPRAPALQPGRFARVTVADQGTGMPAEVMQHLFEPFFTTKALGKGTGMGLATVHGIVNNHGGHVGVSSRPGAGTTFEIHLPWSPVVDAASSLPGPATEPPAAAASADPWRTETQVGTLPVYTSAQATQAAEAAQAAAEKRVILLVDDEALLRRSTQRVLSRLHPAEIVSASDGEEAVSMYRTLQDRVLVVLMDVNMPRKNGLDACAAMRVINPQVRVILTSGSVETERAGPWGRTRGVSFLRKPYDEKALAAALSAALAT